MGREAGARVSHYRLIRPLGAGGMGEVHLAQDLTLDRKVAIKFLVAPEDEQSRRRLLREARAVAALDHPSICAVHEVGNDPANGDFIVMQYVEGESLAARLGRGPLAQEEALKVVAHIADALLAAHRHGIVHRDLKPQNIILSPSGAPKLLDFGLAKLLPANAGAAEALTESQVTKGYQVVGTAGYLAPECIRNQQADVRSDVFSLGCVLYECLTGRRAFTGATTVDVIARVLHAEPSPPSSIVAALGPSYDGLCASMMAKQPEQRLQSAEEVLGAIRALSSSAGTGSAAVHSTPTAPATRRLSRRATAVAAVVVSLVAAAALWQWQTGGHLPTPPAAAQRWYDLGVEALREGAYANARASLKEAVAVYPEYAQAYSRLAEAHAELDDEKNAHAALVRVSALAPNQSRLNLDDQLRLDAVRFTVLRERAEAVRAYVRLAERHPRDAAAWVDVGRAEEAAGQRALAREHYVKAIQLDGQYAVARVRLGAMQGQAAEADAAIASFDEAIRLYQAATNVEGEAEAVLRKGLALSALSKFEPAREALERAVALAADPRYVAQRVRARFELAKITSFAGRFAEAESIARESGQAAMDAGLQSIAAAGLIELSGALRATRQYAAADDQLNRAIQIAVEHGARRTEMRARLQQASLRQGTGQSDEALRLAAEPLKYFADTGDFRLAAIARNVISRAAEDLERFDEASQMAQAALQFAEGAKDDALIAQSLENLAGQHAAAGLLLEALGIRERIEQIHRAQKDNWSLAYDLANHADLLIRVGRGKDARPLLDEVDRDEALARQRPRAALLRGFIELTERRFAQARPLVATAGAGASGKLDSVSLPAKVFDEYARAELGQSRAPVATIAEWPRSTSNGTLRRDLSYWTAQTLLRRNDKARAYAVALQAWSEPGARNNLDLRWRLAAVASLSASGATAAADAATMRTHAETDLQALIAKFGAAAAIYLARPDLAALRLALSEQNGKLLD